MRIINFAKRNLKELIRDPMSIIFGIALPLFMLYIFQQFNIPSEIYKIDNFAPAIIIFSYSFISLFTGQLIAKDRSTSLLTRLFASPMKPYEYIVGYSVALLPIAFIQTIIFYLFGILLGMQISINILISILVLIPISLLYIGLGILIGCIASDKSAPALGSLIVQFVAFTSGMWFSLSEVSKVFNVICNIFPFKYTLDLARNSLNGININMLLTIVMILFYILFIYLIATLIFNKNMKSDNK